MARYTGYFVVGASAEELRQLLLELLEACNLEVTYETSSSIIARENVGQVALAQLVTVEIMFEIANSTASETRITLMAKNEELPLQLNNHCRQMFDLLSHNIINNGEWELLESIAL